MAYPIDIKTFVREVAAFKTRKEQSEIEISPKGKLIVLTGHGIEFEFDSDKHVETFDQVIQIARCLIVNYPLSFDDPKHQPGRDGTHLPKPVKPGIGSADIDDEGEAR